MVYVPPLLALVLLVGLLVWHERWKGGNPRAKQFEGMNAGNTGRTDD